MKNSMLKCIIVWIYLQFSRYLTADCSVILSGSQKYILDNEPYTLTCKGSTPPVGNSAAFYIRNTSLGAVRLFNDVCYSTKSSKPCSETGDCICVDHRTFSIIYTDTIYGSPIIFSCGMKIGDKPTLIANLAVIKADPISEVFITPNMLRLTVGSSQTLTCTTDAGRPNARVQWYLSDGTNLTSSAAQQPDCGPNCSDEVESTSTLVYIGELHDHDKSLYCIASNIDDRYVTSQSVTITIVSPPVFLSGDQQIKLGQTKNDVKIQVNVYSVPEYTSLSWLKGSSVISPSTKYTMTYNPAVLMDTFHGTEVQVDGYRLTLTIHNLEEQDFVNYTLRLSNGVGQTVEHLVVLISAGPPETPSNFSKMETTESTITLQWLPGFDGGHEQMFVIQYRVKDNHQWQDTIVPMTDYASNCQCSSSKLFVFTLTGLNSETFYEIRIYAENKFNRSHPSNIENVTTNRMRQHLSKKDNGTLVGVAAGLSTVTVISLIINGIFTYKMLTDKRSPMKSSSNVDSKDGRSFPEVHYNISDHAVDKDGDTDRDVRRYETLGMKDKPNEYDICEPHQRDNSSGVLHSKRGQNYETLGTKDKPNVYEDLDETSKHFTTKLYSNTLI